MPSFVVTYTLYQVSASQLITQWLWIVPKDILKLTARKLHFVVTLFVKEATKIVSEISLTIFVN